jgi:hypothetical protein
MKKYVILCTIALTGCSSYKSQFDCPAEDGLKCTSLYEVNKKIDRKEIMLEDDLEKTNETGDLSIYFPAHIDGFGEQKVARVVPLPKGGQR